MKKIFLLLLVSLLTSQMIFSQEGEHESNPENEDFYQHRLAVFSGVALIQGAINEEGESVARPIPVFGLDYEFFFNPKYGVGLFNDLEIANYVIPFEENDFLKRQYAFVTSAVFLYEPVLGITLFTGPGYEIETHKSFPVWKLGTELSKSFDGGWSAGIAISFDFKEVNSALSLGLTIVKGIGKPKKHSR